jgi:hypothetical protein
LQDYNRPGVDFDLSTVVLLPPASSADEMRTRHLRVDNRLRSEEMVKTDRPLRNRVGVYGFRQDVPLKGGGADGSGAPRGSKNGNYKHGRYTQEVAATRRWIHEAVQSLRDVNKRHE